MIKRLAIIFIAAQKFSGAKIFRAMLFYRLKMTGPILPTIRNTNGTKCKNEKNLRNPKKTPENFK